MKSDKYIKPNFFIVGTHRAGTTWLYEVFRKHPQVFVPAEKELMFFNDYYHRGIEWYEQFFRLSSKSIAVGEINPNYLAFEFVAQRIFQHYPESRIVAILRNPADQFTSMFYLNKLRKNITGDINSHVLQQNDFPILNIHHCWIDMVMYFQEIESRYCYMNNC